MFPSDLNLFHHAYLLEGGVSEGEKIITNIRLLAKSQSDPITAILLPYPVFTREIAQVFRLTQSRNTDGHFFQVIVIGSYTDEAIETLLKTVEEPSDNTHYIFVCSQIGGLSEPFRSRCTVVSSSDITDGTQEESSISSETFATTRPVARLKQISALMDKLEESGIVRDYAFGLVRDLEKRCLKEKDVARRVKIFKALLTTKKALSSQTVPVRLALEHLATTLP